jgi:hypothetical protein
MTSNGQLQAIPGARRAFEPASRFAFWGWFILGLCWLGWGLAGTAGAADAPPTDTQVKAALLYNIAKYVDWPAPSFASTSAPVVVGIAGGGGFGAEFEKLIAGKQIGDRPIQIRRVAREPDLKECHALFIGATDKKQQAELLDWAKKLPVLTVGESDDFLAQGGIIRFVLKENKVRFQVNLKPARQAQLGISARVLSVADAVLGKPERGSP